MQHSAICLHNKRNNWTEENKKFRLKKHKNTLVFPRSDDAGSVSGGAGIPSPIKTTISSNIHSTNKLKKYKCQKLAYPLLSQSSSVFS